jgi:hypothetical protein
VIRRAYGRAATAQFDALGITAPLKLDHLGSVVEALDAGLAMQRRIDPSAIPENLFLRCSRAPPSGRRSAQPNPASDRC